MLPQGEVISRRDGRGLQRCLGSPASAPVRTPGPGSWARHRALRATVKQDQPGPTQDGPAVDVTGPRLEVSPALGLVSFLLLLHAVWLL